MRYIIVTLAILIYSLVNLKDSFAQNNQVSIITPGAYFFNYAGYKFNTPYKQQTLRTIPSLSYMYIKNKRGFQITGVLYDYTYISRKNMINLKDSTVISRNGFCLSLDYVYNLKQNNLGDVKLLLGLSSKVSYSDIHKFTISHGTWSESISDQDASQVGGLALNVGVNCNIKIYKRFFITSTLRSINFLLGGKYQKNSIWFENGIAYRFGKK